jgi:hypothetical protein
MAIKFEATGDFSDLIAENQKYQRQVTSLTEQLAKLTGGAAPMGDAGVRAFREMQRAADRAKRSIETPVEGFVRQVTLLDGAMGKNMLTANEHSRAVGQLAQQLAEVANPTEQYTQAVTKLNGQLAAGEIDAGQYAEAVEQQKSALDDGTEAGEKHGTMVGDLGKKMLALGAGYMSFQVILGQVKAALAYVNAETDKAIGSADKMTDPNKRLAQVATSSEDYDEMVQRADKLASQFGEQRDVVRNVSFSARSEGFEDALENIIKFSDVVAAESQATVAGQVPNLFGGEISADQGINATLVAAEASRLSFEEIARALPKVSEGAALQKASAAETMGVTSVMAGHFGSGDTAADRFKALATKLSINESTKGLGIIGGVEELQRQQSEWQASGGEGDSPLKKFLGESAELNVAFGLLVERMPDVKQRIAEIETEIDTVGSGGEGALARKHAQSFDTSTETGRLNLAMEERRQAKIAEEIANERQFAVIGAKREAAISQEKARQKEQGYVGISQFAGHAAGATAGFLGMDEQVAAAATRGGTASLGGKSFSGLVGRRIAGLYTGGISDVYAGTKAMLGYEDSAETAVLPPISPDRQAIGQAGLLVQESFRQTRTADETAESRLAVSARMNQALQSGDATEFVEQGQAEVRQRLQQVQADGGPNAAQQIAILQQNLAELQKLTALLAENASATKELRDASRTTPRPGASAAAAAANSQRLGR